MRTKESQNFNLTETQFEDLIEELKDGNDELFRGVFLSHFESCMSYLMKRCSISYDDAYDLSMDTLLVFRQRCIAGKISYGNLRFLYTQMAYQSFLKSKQKAKIEVEEEYVKDHSEIIVQDEERAILDKAWVHLGDKCKQLLIEVFYENMPMASLAEEYNKNAAAIRKQKQRCIEQLRLLFKKTSYGTEI